MEMKFSFIGLGVVVVLVILSLFVQWIFMANIKYKNKDLKTTISENAVKYSTELFNNKIKFKARKWNFWLSEYQVAKKLVYVPMSSFVTSTIYSQVDTTFKSSLVAFAGKRRLDIADNVISKIGFLLITNSFWLFIFNLWIIAIALLGVTALLFIVKQIVYRQAIKKATLFTKEKLHGNNEEENRQIDSYVKYKKAFIAIDFMTIFAEPFISAFALFRDWGKNE